MKKGSLRQPTAGAFYGAQCLTSRVVCSLCSFVPFFFLSFLLSPLILPPVCHSPFFSLRFVLFFFVFCFVSWTAFLSPFFACLLFIGRGFCYFRLGATLPSRCLRACNLAFVLPFILFFLSSFPLSIFYLDVDLFHSSCLSW